MRQIQITFSVIILMAVSSLSACASKYVKLCEVVRQQVGEQANQMNVLDPGLGCNDYKPRENGWLILGSSSDELSHNQQIIITHSVLKNSEIQNIQLDGYRVHSTSDTEENILSVKEENFPECFEYIDRLQSSQTQ